MNPQIRPTTILSDLVEKIQIQLAHTLLNNVSLLNPFLSSNVRSAGIKQSEIDSIMSCMFNIADIINKGIYDGYLSQPNEDNVVYVLKVTSNDADPVKYLKLSCFVLGILFANPLIVAESLVEHTTNIVISSRVDNITALSNQDSLLLIKNATDSQAVTDNLLYDASKILSDAFEKVGLN